MPEVMERIGPAGWKVYTLGATTASDFGTIQGWYLDDEIGIQFLERCGRPESNSSARTRDSADGGDRLPA